MGAPRRKSTPGRLKLRRADRGCVVDYIPSPLCGIPDLVRVQYSRCAISRCIAPDLSCHFAPRRTVWRRPLFLFTYSFLRYVFVNLHRLKRAFGRFGSRSNPNSSNSAPRSPLARVPSQMARRGARRPSVPTGEGATGAGASSVVSTVPRSNKPQNRVACDHAECTYTHRDKGIVQQHEKAVQHKRGSEDSTRRCEKDPCDDESCEDDECVGCHLGGHDAESALASWLPCGWGYCEKSFASATGRRRHEGLTTINAHR